MGEYREQTCHLGGSLRVEASLARPEAWRLVTGEPQRLGRERLAVLFA